MDVTSTENHHVYRFANHSNQMMEAMSSHRSSDKLCDVVLIAGERRVKAHRLVLSAVSDYFSAMFTHDCQEAVLDEIHIQGVDADALQALVTYAYSGDIELKEETVESLLSAACLLQMRDVVKACSSFLIRQLHPSNCLGICSFADRQGCADLMHVAKNFACEHFLEVMKNQEFVELQQNEICSLLASDDLNVPNEEIVFHALVLWCKLGWPARESSVSELLANIKLPLLSPQFLADNVEGNSMFKDNVQCQGLIMEALKYHLLPERRFNLQSARTRPRKATVGALYAVGGMDSGKGCTSIEKYDLRGNQWAQVATMSVRRLQFGVAVLDDKLFVVGGRDGLKTLNTMECYEPKRKMWSLMPAMSTHRHGLGVGVLEGPLYAVGGHDGWSYLNTVERWDPQIRQWSYVAPMATARSTAGVAVLAGKLYAVGGRDGSSCLRSVECFDPHTNKWSACTQMNKRRGGVGVATSNNFLYAIGGHDAPATNPSASRFDCGERYDPKTNEWTSIASMSFPRESVGVSLLGDRLFAVGGHDGQTFLTAVECYDPSSNEWRPVAPLCAGRAGACVVHMRSM